MEGSARTMTRELGLFAYPTVLLEQEYFDSIEAVFQDFLKVHPSYSVNLVLCGTFEKIGGDEYQRIQSFMRTQNYTINRFSPYEDIIKSMVQEFESRVENLKESGKKEFVLLCGASFFC